MMFFEGSLQDGIAKALQEQKLVACFVTDDMDESLRWEAWLKNDNQLRQMTNATAVLLRLVSGSQEAGYLAAFCSLDSTPALIVIRNGIPTAHLRAGLEESNFKDALIDALEGEGPNDNTPSSNASSPTIALSGTIEQALDSSNSAPALRPAHSLPSQSATTPTSPSNSASIPTPVVSREEAEKAKRAAQIKKEQSDASSERKRILAEIENDKKERQARELQRKNLRAEKDQQNQELKPAPNAARKTTKECALRVRTFDGATISSTFPSDQTLHKHVRSWIDETVEDLKEPYEFKWLLTPMPNQRISAADEEETLSSLGLTPNATLVMVPMKGYSTAYSENYPGVIGSTVSLGHGIVSTGYGVVSGGLTMASNLVGSLLGRAESNNQTENLQSTATASSSIRVKTLADQRRDQDDQQLYNGNQVRQSSGLVECAC